jgi:hypothetical protein
MKLLLTLMTIIFTLNLFACPSTHNEIPDSMRLEKLSKVTSPMFMNLNSSFTFPIFEDTLVLFEDANDPYTYIWLLSGNGPQDHVQIFVPHKLRSITDFGYNTVSTDGLNIELGDFGDKNYGDFKSYTQGMISFCYQSKAPIEYR